MKITQECDYAIRIVLYLSGYEEGYKAGAKDISEKQAIPLRFTVKILRKLILSKILKSYKGVSGGYSLARAPEQISLLDITEAIDGPILINRCLSDDNPCSKGEENICPVHREFNSLRDIVRSKLSEVNMAELAKLK